MLLYIIVIQTYYIGLGVTKIIRIKLGEQLKKEHRTKYWLMKETNITITCMNKLINNEASAIYFDTLERICIALNCKPADIIEFTIELNKEYYTNEQVIEKV